MKKIIVCHLEISSFAEISPGAKHYYGRLYCKGYNKGIDLSYKLTKKQAEKLSTKDFKYRSGSISERFFSDEDIIKIAIKTYKKHFPKADILVEGSSSTRDPRPCIDGPDKIKRQINKLYKRSQEIGGYEGDEKAMDKISDEYWYNVLGNEK